MHVSIRSTADVKGARPLGITGLRRSESPSNPMFRFILLILTLSWDTATVSAESRKISQRSHWPRGSLQTPDLPGVVRRRFEP